MYKYLKLWPNGALSAVKLNIWARMNVCSSLSLSLSLIIHAFAWLEIIYPWIVFFYITTKYTNYYWYMNYAYEDLRNLIIYS